MTDENTKFRIDPVRPGIVRFDDDPTAGILVGIKAAEVVRRWNAFPELVAALQACEAARDATPDQQDEAYQQARAVLATLKE